MNQTRRLWTAALSVTAALLTSAVAHAETTTSIPAPGATSSTAMENPLVSQILKKISLTYFTKFDGPAFSSFDSRQADDIYGQVSDPSKANKLLLENSLISLYKLNDNGLNLGATWNFNTPVSRGMDFALADSYVRIQHTKLVHIGNFNISQDFRLGMPTSNSAHNKSELGYVRSVQIINYDIPNTKWSVGSFNAVRWYKYGDGASKTLASKGKPTDTLQDADLLVLPNANYQLTPTVGINIGYEFDAYHNYGDKFLSFTDSSGGTGTSAGSLGVSWDITSKVNLTPFVNVPLGGAALQGAYLSAFFSAKLL